MSYFSSHTVQDELEFQMKGEGQPSEDRNKIEVSLPCISIVNKCVANYFT